jgi:hypothetical protein
MNYPYSQSNRLEEPHNYMYTPFHGEELLRSYQFSRMAVVDHCAAIEHGNLQPDTLFVAYAIPILERLFDATLLESGKKFRTVIDRGSAGAFEVNEVKHGSVNDLANKLAMITAAQPVTTLDLLHALIAVQLINAQDNNLKIWLDRLVQRFEVTKKIYEFYPPGFRKGGGVNISVRLYWLFALAICLFYARSNEIKYLSTLLKICDLLCSLPENVLQGQIPEHGLSAVLATELISVQLLAEKKGVSFASK